MSDDGQPPTDSSGDPETEPTRTVDARGVAGDSPLPASIGRYRILGKLGEGGMGVVYEAEQREPRRRVALKVVRGGQFVDDVRVKMFKREAETLARLKHPNIGAIYESGRTDDGQHFFAMELVRGETLDAYLKTRPGPITPRELEHRLRLYRQLCLAVHYAHQRGVIHRDLKPSNIVISEPVSDSVSDESAASDSGEDLPRLKILDFGLARITEGDLNVSTMVSELGQIKGTLPYMSPEQARGETDAIDVRTDVYALGVILYEMLAGQRPYDLDRTALVEAIRVICEERPRPLQQTWSGVRRLDVDVETIVGKALEKDAERRYSSAAALSEDVGRFLTSQPILARPPSASYQLRKFARRNRVLVGGVAATLIVLVAGVVVSTVFGFREATQRREAEEARGELEKVVEFQASMLQDVNARQMGHRLKSDLRERVTEARRDGGASGKEIESTGVAFDAMMRGVNFTDAALGLLAEDVLGRAAEAIEGEFGDSPRIEGRLRQTVGSTLGRLGFHDQAIHHLQRSVEIQTRELGADHEETLVSVGDLGLVYGQSGRGDQAEPLIRKALEAKRRVLGPDAPETLASLNSLAVMYLAQGKLDQAESAARELAERRARVMGGDHPATLGALSALADVFSRQGRWKEAEELFQDVLERSRSGHPTERALVMNQLANTYGWMGRHDKALPLWQEALQMNRRELGEDHPQTLMSMAGLGWSCIFLGRFDEAESLTLAAIEARRRVLGRTHPDTLGAMLNLSILHGRRRRLAEAERVLVEIVETRPRKDRGEDPVIVSAILNLAGLYAQQRRNEEAKSLLLECLAIQRRVLGDRDPNTVTTLYNLACLEALRGDRESSLERLRQAVDNGWSSADWMARDPDLVSLHEDPRFDALVERSRGNAAAQPGGKN